MENYQYIIQVYAPILNVYGLLENKGMRIDFLAFFFQRMKNFFSI